VKKTKRCRGTRGEYARVKMLAAWSWGPGPTYLKGNGNPNKDVTLGILAKGEEQRIEKKMEQGKRN